MKICVVSEAIREPFDEGVKIFVYNLIREWSRAHEVLGLSRSEIGGEIGPICEKALPENRLFASHSLKKRIRAFKPDMVCYLPTAHVTVFSFIRAKFLKHYGRSARMVLVTLQPRDYSFTEKRLLSLLAPELVLAQSAKTVAQLQGLGCTIKKISCGVDLEKFVPVDRADQQKLRKKYGLPGDKHIVLHVGHINRNRNAQFMETIQGVDGLQGVIVGSTSYPEDQDLVKELRHKGVIVLSDYIERIQEIYQCADCYMFPVISDGACIEIPLSIYEAMACNLPVVTTKYGGLPEFIAPQEGVAYVDDVKEIPFHIQAMRKGPAANTRSIVESRSWGAIAHEILEAATTR